MKKGNVHSLRKVRNNKVKKKRKTMKRKSTYKRKKNKNKKRSIKQKGGNLEKILAFGAGVVLTGALAAVFADKGSFDSSKKHNKNPTSHQTDHDIGSSQHPPPPLHESLKYYKEISIEEIIKFDRKYNKGLNNNADDEKLTRIINESRKDFYFLSTWSQFIVNFNNYIKIIEEQKHNSVKDYFKNIDKYIISQDLDAGQKKQIEQGELEVKNLDQLAALRRSGRKPDGYINSYINFIITSIFLIELNKNPSYIKYSQIFTIDDLQNAIDLIGKNSNNPSEFQFTVDKELVEEIFNDSLEIIKEMDDIVKELIDGIDGDNPDIFNISGNLLDQFLENKFPGISKISKISEALDGDLRPTEFYEQMIERNMREMTTN
jgi:hypothetical protein